jgi:DNA-binding beta-propeller fold protein YncE
MDRNTQFVNNEDTNEVIEISTLSNYKLRKFPLNSCIEPAGMGLDPKNNIVFSGCHNKTMTVLDTKTGKVIAFLPVGANMDGNGFDAGTGFAFSSNGDGTLTVVHETSPGKYEVLDTAATQKGSRTMAVDPKTHNVYLPAALFIQPKEPAQAGAKQRPVMLKDSFEILVVGK